MLVLTWMSSNMADSLRASSPIQASEASLARTRERGAEESRACNHPLQIFISTPETPGLRKASAPRGFAARSRVLARPFSLAQTGELARRLHGGRKPTETSFTEFCYKSVNFFFEKLINIKVILFLMHELSRQQNFLKQVIFLTYMTALLAVM